MNSLLSFVCFVVSWLVCLLCSSNFISRFSSSPIDSALMDAAPLVGPALVAALVVFQSFGMLDAPRTLRLTVVVAILGTILDSALISLGVYWVATPMGMSSLCPLWITAMWVAVGVALHGWLRIFANKILLSSGAGGAGCLATYLLANQLGAIGIDIPRQAAIALFAALGAVILPGLVWLANSLPYRMRTENATNVI